MFKRAAVLVVSCGALLAGCGADVQAENQEIISNLLEAGIPADDITVVEDAVYVGGDAHVTLEASRERLQRGEGSAEQYASPNLVGTSVTRICVVPTTAFSGYTKFIQGLDMAIANYNSLGLRITFQRGGSGCTANIGARTTSGTGAHAGYPSGGLPYSSINIGTNLSSYSVEVIEHVITHELGHTIGLLHSDYYDSSISCGSGGSGRPPPTYRTPIPGTPAEATPGGSLMNTCYPPDTTGEFTSTDRIALQYLY